MCMYICMYMWDCACTYLYVCMYVCVLFLLQRGGAGVKRQAKRLKVIIKFNLICGRKKKIKTDYKYT